MIASVRVGESVGWKTVTAATPLPPRSTTRPAIGRCGRPRAQHQVRERDQVASVRRRPVGLAVEEARGGDLDAELAILPVDLLRRAERPVGPGPDLGPVAEAERLGEGEPPAARRLVAELEAHLGIGDRRAARPDHAAGQGESRAPGRS